MEFDFAHNDTRGGERKSRTAALNKLNCSEFIKNLREYAFSREIPTASDETLNFICNLARAKAAVNILEIGTAVGISGIALLDSCPAASLTTIERDRNFFSQAEKNFAFAGYSERVVQIFGDAAENLPSLPDNSFDFIFLDCAKVQYIKLLPRLKELLKKGGVLLADDVLLYGWITGEAPTPPKRRMLVRHVREFIDAVTSDEELCTSILDVGDGVSFSVKK